MLQDFLLMLLFKELINWLVFAFENTDNGYNKVERQSQKIFLA